MQIHLYTLWLRQLKQILGALMTIENAVYAKSFVSALLSDPLCYKVDKRCYAGSEEYVLSCINSSSFLQPNTHFAAFFEIYKIDKPLHRSKFNCYLLIIIVSFSKQIVHKHFGETQSLV